jgi:hypothetical protein
MAIDPWFLCSMILEMLHQSGYVYVQPKSRYGHAMTYRMACEENIFNPDITFVLQTHYYQNA